MYDSASKVPSPTLLLPTKEQESQFAAARRKKVRMLSKRWRKCGFDWLFRI